MSVLAAGGRAQRGRRACPALRIWQPAARAAWPGAQTPDPGFPETGAPAASGGAAAAPAVWSPRGSRPAPAADCRRGGAGSARGAPAAGAGRSRGGALAKPSHLLSAKMSPGQGSVPNLRCTGRGGGGVAEAFGTAAAVSPRLSTSPACRSAQKQRGCCAAGHRRSRARTRAPGAGAAAAAHVAGRARDARQVPAGLVVAAAKLKIDLGRPRQQKHQQLAHPRARRRSACRASGAGAAAAVPAVWAGWRSSSRRRPPARRGRTLEAAPA